MHDVGRVKKVCRANNIVKDSFENFIFDNLLNIFVEYLTQISWNVLSDQKEMSDFA